MKGNWKQVFGRADRSNITQATELTYEDGFKHGFEAGQSSCAGDISVATLIKELIDRAEYDLAAQLLEEIKARD